MSGYLIVLAGTDPVFNPRFAESKKTLLSNEWFEFARLHGLHFWKERILYSRIPGSYDNDIRRALFIYNGIGSDWPESIISGNDIAFCSSLENAWKAEKSFCVAQHPLVRLIQLPGYLAKNMDGCSITWLEKTGESWQNFSLREILLRLAGDEELMIASHWWCRQEYCLLFWPSHYTRIFRQNDYDDLAWWLGEQGIQLPRTEEAIEWLPDLNTMPEQSEAADMKLSDVASLLADCTQWNRFLDPELVGLSQEVYESDYNLFKGK